MRLRLLPLQEHGCQLSHPELQHSRRHLGLGSSAADQRRLPGSASLILFYLRIGSPVSSLGIVVTQLPVRRQHSGVDNSFAVFYVYLCALVHLPVGSAHWNTDPHITSVQ